MNPSLQEVRMFCKNFPNLLHADYNFSVGWFTTVYQRGDAVRNAKKKRIYKLKKEEFTRK